MTTRRSPLAIIVLVAAIALLVPPPTPAEAARTGRAKMVRFVNHYRHQHGRASLRVSKDATRIAQRHSRLMASDRTLFHSTSLWWKLRSHDPSAWGENVGMGPCVWHVYKMWTQSSDHRDNMLARRYRRTGVGIVHANGSLWITMIYFG
jgi:uncharacterized protein YkwD